MKKIISILLAALVLTTALFTLAGCTKTGAGAETTADTAGKGTEDTTAATKLEKLVLGTSADYAPFEFVVLDDNGERQYAGIDVFLAQKIAFDMDTTLEVVNMDFDYLIASLQKGDFDIVLAAMEADEERLKAVDFSDPYYTDYAPMIVVRAADKDNYTTLADFEGKSVGAQSGTTKADLVTEKMPGANALNLSNVNDLINNLVYNKCDAIVLDGSVAKQYAASNSDLYVIEDLLGATTEYCVAVEKGDPKGLLPSINATIAACVKAGTIEEYATQADALAGDAVE